MKIKVCVVQSTIDFLNALDDHGRKESDPKRRKALDTLAKRIGDARRKYEADIRKIRDAERQVSTPRTYRSIYTIGPD